MGSGQLCTHVHTHLSQLSRLDNNILVIITISVRCLIMNTTDLKEKTVRKLSLQTSKSSTSQLSRAFGKCIKLNDKFEMLEMW